MKSTLAHAMSRYAAAFAVASLVSVDALADPIPPGGQGDRLKVI